MMCRHLSAKLVIIIKNCIIVKFVQIVATVQNAKTLL